MVLCLPAGRLQTRFPTLTTFICNLRCYLHANNECARAQKMDFSLKLDIPPTFLLVYQLMKFYCFQPINIS